VVAQVLRDELMTEADNNYPVYGFAGHKGYGTKAHFLALDQNGLCPLHRRSFLTKYNKRARNLDG
jgi:ribonuclease HII